MDILCFETSEEFLSQSSVWLAEKIMALQEEGAPLSIGLSGGSTPRPVYESLEKKDGIRWNDIELFLVDERYVPPSDQESNQKLVRESLFAGDAVKSRTLFPNTTLPLADCVTEYDQALASKTPDLVILGMGEDGHIASLFPPLMPEAFGPATVIHTTTDQFKVRDRISSTLPFLKSAKHRLFLISGPKKSALLKSMQQANEDASMYPAQYLFDERTTWMVWGGS